jgi:hypothetical protein
MPMHDQYVAAGDPRLDATAQERQAKFMPGLTPAPCQCCGAPTTSSDFWVCRWVYYFSKLGLMSLLATIAGMVFVSTAKVPHATYHWLCPTCTRRVKGARLQQGLLRFVGLFLAGIGLIGSMAAVAALFLPLSSHDRTMVQGWIWLPIAFLIVGVGTTLFARKMRPPGVIGELSARPFWLEGFFHSEPERLEELQQRMPWIYGLAPAPTSML